MVLPSADLPKFIQDYTTSTSALPVALTATITRALVRLNLSHTYDGDLSISLQSPSGALFDLSSRNGGSGDNYTGTVFDSACATSVTSVSAPFAGCYQPEASLAPLAQTPSQGTWNLRVADDASGDSGTLAAWSLALCVCP